MATSIAALVEQQWLNAGNKFTSRFRAQSGQTSHFGVGDFRLLFGEDHDVRWLLGLWFRRSSSADLVVDPVQHEAGCFVGRIFCQRVAKFPGGFGEDVLAQAPLRQPEMRRDRGLTTLNSQEKIRFVQIVRVEVDLFERDYGVATIRRDEPSGLDFPDSPLHHATGAKDDNSLTRAES